MIWNIQKRVKSPLIGAFFCLQFVGRAIPAICHSLYDSRFEILFMKFQFCAQGLPKRTVLIGKRF